MEALACHPLGEYSYRRLLRDTVADAPSDTIKVRMQLSRRARAPGVRLPALGFGGDPADASF